jgi:hypothetical protein
MPMPDTTCARRVTQPLIRRIFVRTIASALPLISNVRAQWFSGEQILSSKKYLICGWFAPVVAAHHVFDLWLRPEQFAMFPVVCKTDPLVILAKAARRKRIRIRTQAAELRDIS